MKRFCCVVMLVIFGLMVMLPNMAYAGLNIIGAIKDLNDSGKESNEYLNHSVIDLVYLSSDGTVTAYTYMGVDEVLTVNNFSVLPQTPLEAHDKLTRFIFELTNRYRPDTDLALSGTGALPTVHAYTYGDLKDEAIWAVVNGLDNCLNNAPYDWKTKYDDDSSNDSSWVDPYSPENITKTIMASTFTLNSITYAVINDNTTETKTMDVAPEIKEGRTFVPVRYLAYALGVPEEGITWKGETQEITITKEDTTIGLTIGSNIEKVNKEIVEMDVTPYIKEGRTMLPARWIAEPLGATVTWNETTQQVKIEVSQEQG